MYKYLFVIVLLPLLSQGQNIAPDDNNAALYFNISDIEGNALQTEIHFFGNNTNKGYKTMSDSTGKGTVLLPVGDIYSAYIPLSDNKYDFQIPAYPNLRFQQNFTFDISNADELHPTPIEAVANLYLRNPKTRKAIIEKVTIQSDVNRFSAEFFPDTNGRVQCLLPINQTYSISFEGAIDYSSISIPLTTFYIVDKTIDYEGTQKGALYPSMTEALIKIHYNDLDNRPVKNEAVNIINQTNNKFYTASTGDDGIAYILVPIGNSYSINTEYDKDIKLIEIPGKEKKYVFETFYKNLCSEDIKKNLDELTAQAKAYSNKWEKDKARADSLQKIMETERLKYEQEQEALRLKQSAEEEAENKRIADSIALAEQEEVERKLKAELQRKKDRLAAEKQQQYIDSISNAMERTIAEKQDSIRNDVIKQNQIAQQEKREEEKLKWYAKYETDKEIWGPKRAEFKVLKRNNWQKRLYIVDVTGSMEAYAQQMKNWFILNYSLKDTAHFVFFNDGDEKLTNQKVIGETGGIHFCIDCNIREMEKTITKSLQWNGGDIPENDIEAILTAIDSIKNYKEIILLADNNSTIRDISLLPKLNVPVRIVLCGVTDDIINEEYLNIAAATKGSVHTIEEDINFLESLNDGDELQIGNRTYVRINNRFVRKRE